MRRLLGIRRCREKVVALVEAEAGEGEDQDEGGRVVGHASCRMQAEERTDVVV